MTMNDNEYDLLNINFIQSVFILVSYYKKLEVVSGLGSSTVDQVLKYTKYPKYIPSTSTGQVLIF